MTSDDNIIFLKGREIRLARGQTFTNEPWLKEPDDIQGWHNKCVCVSNEAPHTCQIPSEWPMQRLARRLNLNNEERNPEVKGTNQCFANTN